MDNLNSFFPYHHRPFQSEIMGNISRTVHTNADIILESGTGTGKTICTIVPLLKYAVDNDKKVLYCTRTNSQQRQVIYELRAVKKHLDEQGISAFDSCCIGLGIQGRQNLCLLTRDDRELLQSTAEELSKLCSDRKNSIIKKKGGEQSDIPGCKYYERMLDYNLAPVENWIRNEIPTAEQIIEYCKDNGICPYELCKSQLGDCVLVTAPYVYCFNKFIRRRLLEWMGCSFEDLILIIDEAHNLPDFARETGSQQLSLNTLKIAKEEAIEFGDPVIAEGMSASYFISKLIDILIDIKNEYVLDEDGFVPPDEVKVELMTRLNVISNKLRVIVKNLLILGEIIRGKRRNKGRLPRSYVHGTASFLEFWFDLEAETHVKLIVDGENPKLEAYCLDPSIVTDIVGKFHSSFHISGTLNPLEEYRDSIGLSPETPLRTFPSPFPVENRMILYVNDVTTKFETLKADEKVLTKIENHIQTVCNKFNGNAIVFFPSYKLLNQLLHRGLHFKLHKKFFIEQQNMSQRRLMELIESFRTEGGILFAVMGGRISEGMDFPGRDLELVILVGIPYPRPTSRQKALQDYYEKKFNKGWEYTVFAPAGRKLLQSIGRLIRTESDKGIAVILDHRSVQFKNQLDGLAVTDNISNSISEFF